MCMAVLLATGTSLPPKSSAGRSLTLPGSPALETVEEQAEKDLLHKQMIKAAKSHAQKQFDLAEKYVGDHEMIAIIEDELAKVISGEDLIFNPFIPLQRRFFVEGVKHLNNIWTQDRIRERMKLHPVNVPDVDAEHPIVGFTDLSGLSVFGLTKVLAYIDAHMCSAYYQIHQDLEESVDPEVQSVISFGGPALFGKRNSFNDEPEFRQDDRMFAPTKMLAQTQYVKCVCYALDHFQVQKKGKHIVLDLTITHPGGKEQIFTMFEVATLLEDVGEGFKIDLEHEWTRFAEKNTAFSTALRDAATVGGEITAHCLFKIETRIGRRAPPFYQQGTIVYTMHYVQKDTMSKAGEGDVGKKRGSKRGAPDDVNEGGPQNTVCGSIPWRSALTGIFFSQEEGDEYASFMDMQYAPHINHRAVDMYKDNLYTQIAHLEPSAEFTQVLDICFRMGTHDDGWPILPECIDAAKAKDSVIELMGVTLDACRNLLVVIKRVPEKMTSNSKKEEETRQLLTDRIEKAMESFLDEIYHMLTALSIRNELSFFGGLQLRLKHMAGITQSMAFDPEPIVFEDLAPHLQAIVKLLKWPQSKFCEQSFHEAPTLLDLVGFCKQRAGVPFSEISYKRGLPHEQVQKEKKPKKGGGGMFGRRGKAAEVDDEHEEGVLGFVHGLEPTKSDYYVVNFPQAAKRVAAPPAVQREAVMLHYLVDTHYDDVVGALIEQQVVRRPLLPNPFFECIHHVRMGMWMVELFGKSDHAIKNACMGRIDKIPSEDFQRLVTLPGAGIWLHSVGVAFIGVDVDKVASILKGLFWIVNDTMPNETPTEEDCSTHCSAVGDVLLYGTIMDHLNVIELHEMYHFAGPTGRSRQPSIDFFASQVVKHACDLKDKCNGQERLFSKIQVGSEHYRDFELDRANMGDESMMLRALVDAAVKNREAIIISVHVLMDGWRYVTVRKSLMFYFESDDNHDHVIPKADIISEYTRMFFTKTTVPRERAEEILLDFLGDIGDVDGEEAKARCKAHLRSQLDRCNNVGDLVEGYRHLFDYCRIADEVERIPAVWRMFHSPVGEMYYAQQLGKDLHDVIHDGVERSIRDQAGGGEDHGYDHAVIEGMAQGFATKVREIIEDKTELLSDLMCADLLSRIQKLWTPNRIAGEPPALVMDEDLAEKFEKIAEGLDEYMANMVVEIHELQPAAEEMLLIGDLPGEIRPSLVHARRITTNEWEKQKAKMTQRKEKKAAYAAMKKKAAKGHRSSKVTFA